MAARTMRASSRARSPPIVAVASPAFVAGAPRQRRRRRDDTGGEGGGGGGGGNNDDDDRGRCRVVTGDEQAVYETAKAEAEYGNALRNPTAYFWR